MTEKTPHILVITREGDRWNCRVECPGVTDTCRAWYECIPCNALDWDSAEYEALDESSEAHGEEHRVIYCGWATPSDDCIVEVHEHLRDAALDALPLDDDGEPEPGLYPITFDTDGEFIELKVLAATGGVS